VSLEVTGDSLVDAALRLVKAASDAVTYVDGGTGMMVSCDLCEGKRLLGGEIYHSQSCPIMAVRDACMNWWMARGGWYKDGGLLVDGKPE